jgi:hypothetical protein
VCYTCLPQALADQAGVLTIWSTSKTSPLYILRESFKSGIVDCAWMDHGDCMVLAACSLDGKVVMLDLEKVRGGSSDSCFL